MTNFVDTASLDALRDQECLSEWHCITQDMVNAYAELTGDGLGEWLHLEPERAALDAPYGGTIVQGSFQIAHLVKLYGEAMKVLEDIDLNYSLNYGFDRVRFVKALPVGAPFRARVKILDLTPKANKGILLKQAVTLEKEDGEATLVAEWLFYLDPRALKRMTGVASHAS